MTYFFFNTVTSRLHELCLKGFFGEKSAPSFPPSFSVDVGKAGSLWNGNEEDMGEEEDIWSLIEMVIIFHFSLFLLFLLSPSFYFLYSLH